MRGTKLIVLPTSLSEPISITVASSPELPLERFNRERLE